MKFLAPCGPVPPVTLIALGLSVRSLKPSSKETCHRRRSPTGGVSLWERFVGYVALHDSKPLREKHMMFKTAWLFSNGSVFAGFVFDMNIISCWLRACRDGGTHIFFNEHQLRFLDSKALNLVTSKNR